MKNICSEDEIGKFSRILLQKYAECEKEVFENRLVERWNLKNTFLSRTPSPPRHSAAKQGLCVKSSPPSPLSGTERGLSQNPSSLFLIYAASFRFSA
ncbi:MAG: hypothetical protein LBR66_05935 [Candidatus Symbiothrix sp.]|nr:hypothetical protein [Candidatus Symbiothrix sp.]